MRCATTGPHPPGPAEPRPPRGGDARIACPAVAPEPGRAPALRGRGYAPGEIAGDSGLGVGGEVNRAIPLDGGRWLQQLEPYLLLEAARVHSRLAPARDAQLRSVALGLRLTDNRHYALDLAAAKPTGDPSPNNPERRIRFSLLLSYQFDTP